MDNKVFNVENKEFRITLTFSVVSYKNLSYTEAKKAIFTIPRKEIIKLIKETFAQYKERCIDSIWVTSDLSKAPKEGIYLRALTYDEKYNGQKIEEEPFPLCGETIKCQTCGKVTPFTDEGGRCETGIGWMCHDCIEIAKKCDIELHFQDEDSIE